MCARSRAFGIFLGLLILYYRCVILVDEKNIGKGGDILTEREIRTEERLKRIWAHPALCRFLIILGKVSQYSVAVYFAVQLILHMVMTEYFKALAVALSAAVGFVIVTLMRKLISAPRPYEILHFCEVAPRKKTGESFPSRHAYSAVVIAVLSAALSPWCLIGIVPVAVSVCLTRVLLGIHFVKDVTVGAIIGIAFGTMGVVISLFI